MKVIKQCQFLLMMGLFCFSISGTAVAVSFKGLGYLPGGGDSSRAIGISADGLTVVGQSDSEAFKWTEMNGMVGLGHLKPDTAYESMATGVSADGSVVVGYSDSEAFLWTQDNGMVGLGYLPGGGSNSRAYNISADGSVVVGYSDSVNAVSDDFEAFVWTQIDGMVGLGDLLEGIFKSFAFGINSDGSTVVGGGYSETYGQPFLWTPSKGMIRIGSLPGEASDISADGSTVVGISISLDGIEWEAFLWTEAEGMVGLGDLPGGGYFSFAKGVSSDGSTVVGFSQSASDTKAFLWTKKDGMQNIEELLTEAGIDMTGWNLREALDVSADGKTIVGAGVNPQGRPEAWIAIFKNDLAEAIQCLQIAAGMENVTLTKSDVTGDDLIGLEEAIHSLQNAADMR